MINRSNVKSRKRGRPRKVEGAEDSRERILDAAVCLAAKVGLDALTISLLADEVGMSKAGLFAHFGSKEELQLVAIDTARKRFLKDVLAPVQHVERGLPRLYQTMMAWIRALEGHKNRGGCFFYAANAEFDGKPGAVRDTLTEVSRQWLDWLTRQAALAVERGHLTPDTNPEQLAFELHAFGQEANWASQLLRDERAFERARSAVHKQLIGRCTDEGRQWLPAR